MVYDRSQILAARSFIQISQALGREIPSQVYEIANSSFPVRDLGWTAKELDLLRSAVAANYTVEKAELERVKSPEVRARREERLAVWESLLQKVTELEKQQSDPDTGE